MQIYITDKTGKKFWNTSVSAEYSQGERNNLNRHMEAVKSGKKGYSFVDSASAKLVEEFEDGELQMTDAEADAFMEQKFAAAMEFMEGMAEDGAL